MKGVSREDDIGHKQQLIDVCPHNKHSRREVRGADQQVYLRFLDNVPRLSTLRAKRYQGVA